MKPLILLISLILFTACTKNNQIDLEKYFNTFIQQNNDFTNYGRIDVNQIIKSEYFQNYGLLTEVFNKEYKTIKESINLDKQIYLAIKNPTKKENTEIFAFFQIKNIDTLTAKIGSMGYFVEDYKDGTKLIKENNFIIGLKNNLGIVIVKNDINIQKEFIDNLFNLESKENSISDLNTKNHIQFISKINKNNTTDSNLKSISEVNFFKGKIEIKAKLSGNKNELKQYDFFKTSKNDKLKELIFDGSNLFGAINFNVDIQKFENYMNEYFPEEKDIIIKNIPILNGLTGKKITPSINDNFGLVFMQNNDAFFNPTFSYYIKFLNKDMINNNVNQSINTQMFQGNYYVQTERKNIDSKENSKLNLPKFANDFGNNGIDLFIDFNKVSFDKLFLNNSMISNLKMVEYIKFKANKNESILTISLSDKSKSLVEKIIETNYKNFEENLNY